MVKRNEYPYQDSYTKFLKQHEQLADSTIVAYDQACIDLFAYLNGSNVHYQQRHKVSTLEESDIRDYLTYSESIGRITTDGGYNRILISLNRYFRFLYGYRFSSKLPTIGIKQRHVRRGIPNGQWLNDYDKILKDASLTYYGRLLVLLTKHNYTMKEMLTPGFRVSGDDIRHFNDTETAFWHQFQNFVAPRQAKAQSEDLFLKKRVQGQDPHLSPQGLHIYLKQDEAKLGYPLNPRSLRSSYMVNEVRTHLNVPPKEMQARYRLSPTSYAYYLKFSALVDE